WAPARTDVALPPQGDVVVRGHPLGHLHHDRPLDALASIPVAGGAGVDDLLPRSPTGRARSRAHDLTADAPLHAPDLAHPPAGAARLRPVGRGGAGPGAARARIQDAHLDLLLDARRHLG